MKNNVYMIYYKNGNTLREEALSLAIDGNTAYELKKATPWDNKKIVTFSADMIERIECIEKNNDLDDEEALK